MPDRRPISPGTPPSIGHATSIGPDQLAEIVRQFGGVLGTTAPGAPKAAGPILKTLGKSVTDLLGSIFTAPKGSSLPQRMRFVNWDAKGKLMNFRADAPKGTPAYRERIDATLDDVDRMLRDGALGLQPRPEPAAAADLLTQSPALSAVPKPIRRAISLADQMEGAKADPRNPTIGTPRENKTPMRAALDTMPKRQPLNKLKPKSKP